MKHLSVLFSEWPYNINTMTTDHQYKILAIYGYEIN